MSYEEYACWGPPQCNKQTRVTADCCDGGYSYNTLREKVAYKEDTSTKSVCFLHIFLALHATFNSRWLCLLSSRFALVPCRGCTLLIHFPSDGNPFQIPLMWRVLSDLRQECHSGSLSCLGHYLGSVATAPDLVAKSSEDFKIPLMAFPRC